jgi:hypothetical protein
MLLQLGQGLTSERLYEDRAPTVLTQHGKGFLMQRLDMLLIARSTQMDITSRAKEVRIAPAVYFRITVPTDVFYGHCQSTKGIQPPSQS